MTPTAKIADLYLQRGEKVTVSPPTGRVSVIETDAGVVVVKVLEFDFYDAFNWPMGGLVPITQQAKWDAAKTKPRHIYFVSADLQRWAFLSPNPEGQEWVVGNVEIDAGEGPVPAYTCDAMYLKYGDL